MPCLGQLQSLLEAEPSRRELERPIRLQQMKEWTALNPRPISPWSVNEQNQRHMIHGPTWVSTVALWVQHVQGPTAVGQQGSRLGRRLGGVARARMPRKLPNLSPEAASGHEPPYAHAHIRHTSPKLLGCSQQPLCHMIFWCPLPPFALETWIPGASVFSIPRQSRRNYLADTRASQDQLRGPARPHRAQNSWAKGASGKTQRIDWKEGRDGEGVGNANKKKYSISISFICSFSFPSLAWLASSMINR